MTIKITVVFNTIQKRPKTGIHLKVGEAVEDRTRKQVGGELSLLSVRTTIILLIVDNVELEYQPRVAPKAGPLWGDFSTYRPAPSVVNGLY